MSAQTQPNLKKTNVKGIFGLVCRRAVTVSQVASVFKISWHEYPSALLHTSIPRYAPIDDIISAATGGSNITPASPINVDAEKAASKGSCLGDKLRTPGPVQVSAGQLTTSTPKLPTTPPLPPHHALDVMTVRAKMQVPVAPSDLPISNSTLLSPPAQRLAQDMIIEHSKIQAKTSLVAAEKERILGLPNPDIDREGLPAKVPPTGTPGVKETLKNTPPEELAKVQTVRLAGAVVFGAAKGAIESNKVYYQRALLDSYIAQERVRTGSAVVDYAPSNKSTTLVEMTNCTPNTEAVVEIPMRSSNSYGFRQARAFESRLEFVGKASIKTGARYGLLTFGLQKVFDIGMSQFGLLKQPIELPNANKPT